MLRFLLSTILLLSPTVAIGQQPERNDPDPPVSDPSVSEVSVSEPPAIQDSSDAPVVVLDASADPGTTDQARERAAILAAIEAYVEAYNQGDADTLATLWHPRGVWTDADGRRIQGRDAIHAEIRKSFEEQPRSRVVVSDIQIRFLAPTVAVEEGTATSQGFNAEQATATYLAIHVKTDDGWKLESLRETATTPKPSNYSQLKDLEWLIGSWVDKDGPFTIETVCEWTANRNFMTRSFKVMEGDRLESAGTQVIGWDASKQQIRSWVFDSTGSFGEGTWSHDGERWYVKTRHVMLDGAVGSSINIITPLDQDNFQWQSTGREVDGEPMPSIEPVTITRKS